MVDSLYYIYAEESGKSSNNNTHVLAKGTDTDKYIATLSNKGIILKSEPNPIAEFDSTDAWAAWMTNFDSKAKLSLAWDDQTNKNIQSFQLEFATPFSTANVVFSSSTAAINNSFGPPTGGASGAKIPIPGIGKDGDILYCGLDTANMSKLQSTVKDLFTYTGIEDLADTLPAVLSGASVSLDPAKAFQQRDALWVRPSFGFETTVRFAFELDDYTRLQDLIAQALPGLELPIVSVVAKKILTQGQTADGTSAVDTGSVVFYADAKIKPPSGSDVNLGASVEFGGGQIALTFLFSGDVLDGILSWLGNLISSDLGKLITNLIEKDDIFGGATLRRVRVSLDAADPTKPTLSSFGVDIEIPAKFGQGSSTQQITFLLSYFYSKDTGALGSITGQFWPPEDALDDTSPYYEPWTTLVPSNSKTASSIDLSSVIKGQSIVNIPDTIPQQITRASVTLTDSSFQLGATVTANKPDPGSVPITYLGEVDIDASYSWGKASGFQLAVQIAAGMTPSSTSTNQVTASLVGQLKYDSTAGSWELTARLEGLYASALADFFGASAEQVTPLIESIAIDSLDVVYKYSKGTGSFCSISGVLFIAELELDLDFTYDKSFKFIAKLKPSDDQATLGSVISSIVGDDELDIPDFAANMELGKDSGLSISVIKVPPPPPPTNGGPNIAAAANPFLFVADLKVGALELGFAQYRSSDWLKTVPSKRVFKAAITKLPDVEVKLVGNITKPFDEMYYLWVQDNSGKNKPGLPGLTREEEESISEHLKLVPKDNIKEPKPSDVLISAGSHFAIIMKDATDKPVCILDYEFGKPQANKTISSNTRVAAITAPGAAAETGGATNGTAQAPLKKTQGPITIRNLGIKYANNTLHVILDASLVLGPLGFALNGFSLLLGLTTLDKPETWSCNFALEGLSVVFDKTPLTIAGTIRHGDDGNLDYYAGGLIVGFVPYQFMAAGFYGKATDNQGNKFTSVFVFAKLDGPLVTLEFATISGVTGGIGYNSDVRTPKAAEITQFPFVASSALSGSTDDALQSLEKLVSPKEGGWFSPMPDSYWAAAGMKVDAFQMLSIDAVVVVQFAASIKLGLYAVATADIPTAASPEKFAHVELGIAITVDFGYGILKAEGQLSPNSYILAPDCHLTGGFGFCYWFDAPHADQSNVGQFVFTVGGYHQAFQPPISYPTPPRLGISWNLGKNLSVVGEAYFAITPKVCMGGGRLHAAFSAGPIEAWFDAFANFLINYKPFHFLAEAGVSVGVRFNLDLLFIHTHISAEIGATLTLWGPPLAGRVHVNLWVHAFDINFGDKENKPSAVSLPEFFQLVQQSNQQATGANNAHVFLALTGLMNSDDSPEKKPDAVWTVRGGTFSFVINCVMAIDTATSNESTVQYFDDTIYAKPMHLQSRVQSNLTIQTFEGDVEQDLKWGLEHSIKSVPSGLWGYYNPSEDPSGGKNNVSALLNSDGTGVPLMMGVTLTAPPPIMSPDPFPAFNIADADLLNLPADKNFPKEEPAHAEFRPVAPLVGPKPHTEKPQFDAVYEAWTQPTAGSEETENFVKKWASAFRWDADAMSQVSAIPRKLKAQFSNLYVAAPLLTA